MPTSLLRHQHPQHDIPGQRRHDFPFTSKLEFFCFFYHITIVHKEEARERLCELANGMRGVHSLREETILLFYSCIYLAFWVISIGLFQHTRQEEGILSALQGDLFAFSAV